MKIVKYNCGCVKVDGESIYLHYCEGDSNEYGFYYNELRQCEGESVEIIGDERFGILRTLHILTMQGRLYQSLRTTLQSFLNDSAK